MTKYETKTIEQLGLVSAMIDELGIVKIIDEAIEQDMEERIVSVGTAVKAMILNGLGFANRQIYLFPQFFENKPIEELLGNGIKPSNLNDKVLGRALDKLYEKGVTPLFSLIINQALKNMNYIVEYFHLDSTSFQFYGNNYNKEEENSETIKVTQGYSKDHRPDLNQVMLNLICENKHGIPLAMKALSGNTSDKTSFEEMIKEHLSLIQSVPTGCVVADSALYSEKNIVSMQNHKVLWITRIPETIKEANEKIDLTSLEKMISYKKKDEKEEEENYFYSTSKSFYGGIEQNWVIVYSKKAEERSKITLQKTYEKKSEKELNEIHLLEKCIFACEKDAVKSIDKLKKSLKIITIETEITAVSHYKKRGRPSKNINPDLIEYAVICTLVSSSLTQYYQDLYRKSCFVLASNDISKSPEDIISAYKNQYIIERGFRFLKSSEFSADSFFVKKPERIEALLMIMTLCLFVYSVLEFKIRNVLTTSKPFFPDQKNKPTQTPTARWVFQTFIDVHLLIIDQSLQVLNLKSYHIQLIHLLGQYFIKNYFLN